MSPPHSRCTLLTGGGVREITWTFRGERPLFIEIDAGVVTASFLTRLLSNRLYQDSPHGLCSRGKEMSPGVPTLNFVGVNEPDISVVH